MYPLYPGNHIFQLGYIAPSLLSLSKTLSNELFWSSRDKDPNMIPGLDNICTWIPWTGYYLVQATSRMTSIALIMAYYKKFSSGLVPLLFILNLALVYFLKPVRQHYNIILTSVASVTAPFIFKNKYIQSDLQSDREANMLTEQIVIVDKIDEKKCRQFFRWASLAFALNLAVHTLILNLLSWNNVIEVQEEMAGLYKNQGCNSIDFH